MSRPAVTGARDLTRCVDYINQLDRQPQLVVHTGDIVHNGRPEEYAVAGGILSTLRPPFCVMVGNRDERTALRAAFSHLLPENCHPRFIQYMAESEDNCLLMLDTVSSESNQGQLCDERLVHLAGMFDRAGGKPAIIFMHHPPFEITESRYPFQFADWANADAFAALVGQYPNIRSVRCGHSHRQAIGEVSGTTAVTIPSMAEDLRLGSAAGLEVIAPLLQLP